MIADRQYTVIVQNTADVERIQRIPSAWSIQIFAKSHKKLLIGISHLVGKYIIANFWRIVKYWIYRNRTISYPIWQNSRYCVDSSFFFWDNERKWREERKNGSSSFNIWSSWTTAKWGEENRLLVNSVLPYNKSYFKKLCLDYGSQCMLDSEGPLRV